jgi:hypothetical protein
MVSVIPKVRFRDSQLAMAHGAGGMAGRRLAGLDRLHGANEGPER